MQLPKHFLDTALRRSAMLNRIILKIADNNLRFGFELTRIKTIFDVLKLQTDCWQNLLNASRAALSLKLPPRRQSKHLNKAPSDGREHTGRRSREKPKQVDASPRTTAYHLVKGTPVYKVSTRDKTRRC